MQTILLVALGGALGSVARFLCGLLVGQAWRDPFPLGTLLINIAGSLAMGLLIGWLARALPSAQSEIRLFVAVGVLGGFTTFSTFSLDVVAMLERGDLWQAGVYVLASVLAGIAALWLGLYVMRLGVTA